MSNDNRPVNFQVGLYAAEAAMAGIEDNDKLVACLSWVLTTALEHRLEPPARELPSSVTDIMSRVFREASIMLSCVSARGKVDEFILGYEFVCTPRRYESPI
jgi:hypothetical protein